MWRFLRTHSRVGGGLVLAIFVPTMLLMSAQSSRGKALTAAQMRAAFGDGGSDPCVKKQDCSYAIQRGSDQCAYCDTAANRVFCCNQGTGTACKYQSGSGSSSCNDRDRYIGTAIGPYGNCLSCTADDFAQKGKCTGIQDATGDDCP